MKFRLQGISLDICIAFAASFSQKSGTDRTGGAGFFAVAAADTFGRINVFGYSYTHFTCFFAGHAADTFILVKAHVVKTELIEKSVKRAERAKIFAERSVDQHG